jgi:hypothetical protein
MASEARRYVAPPGLDELIDELLLAAGPKRNHMGAIKFGRLCKYAAVKLDRLRGALEPFADVIGEGDEDYLDDAKVTVQFGRTTHYALTLGDFRRTVLVQRSDEPQTDVDLTASAASEVTSDPTGLIERLIEATRGSSVQEFNETRDMLAQTLLLQSQKIDALEARCEYYVEMMQGRDASLSTLRQEVERKDKALLQSGNKPT